jgi:hypothetical protein
MNKQSTLILTIVCFLLLNLQSFSQNPNFHIYLCFGQSNMAGQGAVEAQDKIVDARFKVFQAVDCSGLNRSKAKWYTAVPPLCTCNSGLSPADYFGRTMVANLPDSITVGVINVSVPGCDIRLFDKDIYMDYDSTYVDNWFTSLVAAYDWNPYQYLIDLAKLAQKDGVIKGILLHQGEANTGDSKWPSYVKKIYTEMLADLSLKADSVPLLSGEVVSAPGNCCGTWMNPIIDKLPTTIPTAHIISSEDCTAQDAAHFDSQGYRKFGMRYAATMLSLLGVDVKILEPEVTYFETECSNYGNNWNEISDATASNKSYLTIKPGFNNTTEASNDSENAINFNFTAKSDTTFYVYARLNCPTATSNSFWAKMDNEPFEYIDNLTTGGWNWLKLKSFELKAGNHTLVITYGEEGAKIDKIFIANYDLVPTGMGGAAVKICSNTVHKVPGKIEAELFSDQNGIQAENTGDTGGGLNIGYIDNNDWIEYAIDVESDAVYTATFRCAAPSSGGAVSLLFDGEKVGSLSFTGTGAWQTYKSFAADIPLKAGKHTLRLLVSTAGFNLNWFMFEKKKVTGNKNFNEVGLQVFPNPTNGELNIESNAFQFDKIEIVDYTGRSVYSKSVGHAKLISFNPGLQKGGYILKLSNNAQTKNLKINIE